MGGKKDKQLNNFSAFLFLIFKSILLKSLNFFIFLIY